MEAVRVFELCVTSQIHLEPEWIPREKNQLADYLSRIIDYDDWYLDPSMFVRLDYLWGPHSVDRFANHLNTHLPRFNSRHADIGSEAIDTFTAHWSGENKLVLPATCPYPQGFKTCRNMQGMGHFDCIGMGIKPLLAPHLPKWM